MERKHKSYSNFLPFHDGMNTPLPLNLKFKYWEQEKHLELKTEKGPFNKGLKI